MNVSVIFTFMPLTCIFLFSALEGNDGWKRRGGTHLASVRGARADHREPGTRDRAHRGRRGRPRAHGRALRHDHHGGRVGRAQGVRHLGAEHGRRAAFDELPARRARAVRVPPRPGGAAQGGRFSRSRPLAGAIARSGPLPDLPGHADAPPWRAHGELLRGGQGGGRGLHGRGRGVAGALRLPGGGGDRERPRAPRGAPRAGGPRSPGGDLAGGGWRCSTRGRRSPRP